MRPHRRASDRERALTGHHLADPRYGWVLVAGGLVSTGFQAAIFFAMALLLAAIPEDTGWSRAATAAALSTLVLGSGLWSPVVGALLQRWGARRTMPASAVVLAAGGGGGRRRGRPRG